MYRGLRDDTVTLQFPFVAPATPADWQGPPLSAASPEAQAGAAALANPIVQKILADQAAGQASVIGAQGGNKPAPQLFDLNEWVKTHQTGIIVGTSALIAFVVLGRRR